MTEKELEVAEAKGLTEYFKLTTKITTSNMIAFDAEGRIKKYDSPEHIIEEFYSLRLAYYQKRKVSTFVSPFSCQFQYCLGFGGLGATGAS